MHTAVLVIDVQQGLCEGPDAAHDCPGTIERINAKAAVISNRWQASCLRHFSRFEKCILLESCTRLINIMEIWELI